MELIGNTNRLLGDNLERALRPSARLKIATSCSSIYAFEALKAELKKTDELQSIFTSPTFTANEVTDKIRKGCKEFHILKAGRERSLYKSEFEIQLRNKSTQRVIARERADWMRHKATFKSDRSKAPMQQFACVQAAATETAYTPPHGFIAVDFGYRQGNTIPNLVNKMDEPMFTATYPSLFDQIWQDPEKLENATTQTCNHIMFVYQESSPESIYFLMLYNIFSELLGDVNEDALLNDHTGHQDTLIWNKFFNYQRGAAVGIINELEGYNGCILADSAGLGKVFTALAVIKYYGLRNKSALVLYPKKLVDNWLNYGCNLKANIFAHDRPNHGVLCRTGLNRTSGESFGTPLNRVNWGNCDPIVIDESHNFRNNDAYKDKETHYQELMNKVIKEDVKTRMLMLLATPVSSRSNNLRSQPASVYEGDSESLSKKLRTDKTVEGIFRGTRASFNAWAKLPSESRATRVILDSLNSGFFELLNNVAIARSRKHIQIFYDTKEIGQFLGRREPLSLHYSLTQRTDMVSFNEIFERLSLLKLAVHTPISYILSSQLKKYEKMYDTQVAGKSKFKQVNREKSLQALMTINLFKCLESSIESFHLTLKSLYASHMNMLVKISILNETSNLSGTDNRINDLTDQLENLDTDDDLPCTGDGEIGDKAKISLADMDLLSREHGLKIDLEIIDVSLTSMNKIMAVDDAKLQHLKTLVQEKVAVLLNPGNKKVLIFAASADTADYLYANLAPELLATQTLHSAKVTDRGVPESMLEKSHGSQELFTLSSPRLKERAIVPPNETAEVDLLIGTDYISEGQNLQDCGCLINYDTHWNPVRIIQRFSRVDHTGSPNSSIQLINYWPDISLDEYINLREWVESRMMTADTTATDDDNVLSAQANDVSYRREQLRRSQEEVIEPEDLKIEVSITDLGLNDFRMGLLNYMKVNDELNDVPNGIHAVVSTKPEMDLRLGVVFALHNQNPNVNVGQYNRLHPYYPVYVNREGEVTHDYTEVERLLDLVRSCCKGQAQLITDACLLFNKETADGSKMQVYSDLLGKAVRLIVEVKEEEDLDGFLSAGRITVLANTIIRLDDFELTTFLVIQEAG